MEARTLTLDVWRNRESKNFCVCLGDNCSTILGFFFFLGGIRREGEYLYIFCDVSILGVHIVCAYSSVCVTFQFPTSNVYLKSLMDFD